MHVFKMALAALALSSTVISTSSFAADCETPSKPTAVDGKSASYEQMVAGQQAVKAFQAANSAYMSCLDPMISAAGDAAKADGASKTDMAAVKDLEAMYNAAVSMEEEVAGEFNTALRAYKAANPS